MFKNELLKLYEKDGLTMRQLQHLLNKKYYPILQPLGYEKSCQFLPPAVVNKFFEIFGKPLNLDDDDNQ